MIKQNEFPKENHLAVIVFGTKRCDYVEFNRGRGDNYSSYDFDYHQYIPFNSEDELFSWIQYESKDRSYKIIRSSPVKLKLEYSLND